MGCKQQKFRGPLTLKKKKIEEKKYQEKPVPVSSLRNQYTATFSSVPVWSRFRQLKKFPVIYFPFHFSELKADGGFSWININVWSICVPY